MAGLYVKLDTAFTDDERIAEAGWDGAGVYAHLLCIAKRLEKDGRIGVIHLQRLAAPTKILRRLVALGLLVEHSDGAVSIASWLEHNMTAAEIRERRAADAERKRQARALRPAGLQAESVGNPGGIPQESLLSRAEDGIRRTRYTPEPVTPPDFVPDSTPADPALALAAVRDIKTKSANEGRAS